MTYYLLQLCYAFNFQHTETCYCVIFFLPMRHVEKMVNAMCISQIRKLRHRGLNTLLGAE